MQFQIEISKKHASVLLLSICIVGCSNQPTRIHSPDWDPEELVSNAFELLDSNNNQLLESEELESAPGLLSSTKYLDKNDDESIDRDELLARLKLIDELRVGLVSTPLRLTLNGKPLPEAEVRFVPDGWLKDTVGPAYGITDQNGTFYPMSEGVELPGVRVGFYRVEVESKRINPQKASSALQTLGWEVSPVSDGQDRDTISIRY